MRNSNARAEKFDFFFANMSLWKIAQKEEDAKNEVMQIGITPNGFFLSLCAYSRVNSSMLSVVKALKCALQHSYRHVSSIMVPLTTQYRRDICINESVSMAEQWCMIWLVIKRLTQIPVVHLTHVIASNLRNFTVNNSRALCYYSFTKGLFLFYFSFIDLRPVYL